MLSVQADVMCKDASMSVLVLFVDLLFWWSITVLHSTGSHWKAQTFTSSPTWNQTCEGICPLFQFVVLLPDIMTLLMQNLIFDAGTWIVFGEHQGTQSSWLQANYVHKRRWEWKAHENHRCKGRCSAQVYQVLISQGRPCFVIKFRSWDVHLPSWSLCLIETYKNNLHLDSGVPEIFRSDRCEVFWPDLKIPPVPLIFHFAPLDFDSIYGLIWCFGCFIQSDCKE